MSVDHTKNIIEVHNVSFSYGKEPVLKNISLTVHQGDYLGIIGPNGAGKTTLLQIMLGLLQPTRGTVNLLDRKKIGYVAQKAINFDPLFPVTVYEVVAMGRYGKKGLLNRLTAIDHTIIDQSLAQVEMDEYRNRLIGDLSSGQQQRVFIARALAGEPSVIFLDEPTVGIDVKTQGQFYALLKKLNLELGLTLILISHDIDVIAHEVTELACINQSLVYHGLPSEFMLHHHH